MKYQVVDGVGIIPEGVTEIGNHAFWVVPLYQVLIFQKV